MHFSFDHIVHFVENPEEAASTLRDKGFHAVEGGSHQNKGTYNTLCYFHDLSYIEFLGAFDKQVVRTMNHAKHSMRETIVHHNFKEGFIRFAIRTNNIEEVARHLRAKGLEVNGPERMIRKRPDGSEVKWYLLFAGKDGEYPQLPFIIQWDDSDESRKTDLKQNNTIGQHPNGVTKLKSISIAVKDLEKTAASWADYFQLPIGKLYFHSRWNANCQEITLPGGNIVFASPVGEGTVATILEDAGQVIFQVDFSNGEKEETFDLFGGVYQINESMK